MWKDVPPDKAIPERRGKDSDRPPLFESLLPFILSAPPEMARREVGNLIVSIPEEWRTDLDTPRDEGAWFLGTLDEPEVYFAVLRDRSFDALAVLIAPKGMAATIAGRAAMSYFGAVQNSPGSRARLVVLKDPESDGRHIAFLARATETAWAKHASTFDSIFASIQFAQTESGETRPPPPDKPPESPAIKLDDLKELTKVSRITDFTAAIAYTAYDDRVLLINANGKTSTIGVSGRGKAVGAGFRDFLAAEPAVAAVLGEAVSLEMTVLDNTLLAQVFEGGTLVKGKASGKVWWNAHSKRPRNLRPADELTRYPVVQFNGRHYEISTYPDRLRISDEAARAEIGVKVIARGRPIPAEFRAVIEESKLEASLGQAASEPLFDTLARMQVYDGGVIIVEPGTNRSWWCRHTMRSTTLVLQAIRLPKDPNTVVIQLDYVSGYTHPRKSKDSYLRIRADGRVTLIDPFGQHKTVEAMISNESLLAFLKFAVEEYNFFRLDTTTLERAIRNEAQGKKIPTIADLPTTVITIRTADRAHEVRCYAPEFYAEQFPGLRPLQDYQAIHQRLARYMEALQGP